MAPSASVLWGKLAITAIAGFSLGQASSQAYATYLRKTRLDDITSKLNHIQVDLLELTDSLHAQVFVPPGDDNPMPTIAPTIVHRPSPTPTSAPPGAIVVDDFDQGPNRVRSDSERICERGIAGSVCDSPGLGACLLGTFCNGTSGGGAICPSYVRDPGREGYFLHLAYEISNPTSFVGVTFGIPREGSRDQCKTNRQPIDLARFDQLSLRVRPYDSEGNLQVQLKAESHDPRQLIETAPPVVLISHTVGRDSVLPKGQWTEVHLGLCNLLRRTDGSKELGYLDRSVIVNILLSFSKERFIVEGTDYTGVRELDIDDIRLLPCPASGCVPCH